VFDRSFAGLPRDQVAELRHELRLRLQDLAGRARDNHGLDLYVPTERRHGVTAAASFVVAEVSVGSVPDADPALLVAQLIAGDAHTSAVTVDGTIGARAQRVAAADAACGVEHASRRVDYVLPVPADPDRWVVVSLSTLGSGDPDDELAQLLVELFDAMMTTFRWRRP